jgi:hypothetical protein
MTSVCLDCDLSRAIGIMAYCRKKRVMVKLSQSSCELFENGLARYRRTNLLAFSLLPFVRMTTVPQALGNIGAWIDKVFTLCLVVVILLLILFILWLLSKFFGGGTRG